MMEGAVTVNAISSTYVGSGITRRSSSDLTASGATVTVPSGYYSSQGSKSVSAGSAGTPTATKGTVSNHAVSVSPSVTNTTGYITGGTINGTAVSVSASELVSGTYTVTSSGTKDVTNYASASIASGTEGTPSATKGTVSNHSVSVTPSVTNVAGWISGSTKTGTAVTVSASELVSGSDTVTTNDTYDVTNLAELVVNVPSSTPTIQSLTVTPSTTQQTFNASGVDGYKPVTVSAVSQTNLTAGNIKSGTTITISNGTSNLWSVTGTYSGGGSVNIDTKTVTASNYPVSISFASMKGQPLAFFLRSTSQISSSGSTTYYYIIDMRYNGTNTTGNCFRIGSTRRVDNVTSGYSWSYSGTTLTITSSASSRSASPGAFNNGYELVYIY